MNNRKPLRLSAIRKRLKSITPGPWQVIPDIRPDVTTEQMIFTRSGQGGYCDEGQLVKRIHAGMRNDGHLDSFVIHPENYVVRLHICELAKYYDQKYAGSNSADADFIAHAPDDIAALLAEVDRLYEELKKERARK